MHTGGPVSVCVGDRGGKPGFFASVEGPLGLPIDSVNAFLQFYFAGAKFFILAIGYRRPEADVAPAIAPLRSARMPLLRLPPKLPPVPARAAAVIALMIPIVQFGTALALPVVMILPGTDGANRHGPDPKAPSGEYAEV